MYLSWLLSKLLSLSSKSRNIKKKSLIQHHTQHRSTIYYKVLIPDTECQALLMWIFHSILTTLLPFCGCRNWGSKKESHLLKDTRAQVWSPDPILSWIPHWIMMMSQEHESETWVAECSGTGFLLTVGHLLRTSPHFLLWGERGHLPTRMGLAFPAGTPRHHVTTRPESAWVCWVEPIRSGPLQTKGRSLFP